MESGDTFSQETSSFGHPLQDQNQNFHEDYEIHIEGNENEEHHSKWDVNLGIEVGENYCEHENDIEDGFAFNEALNQQDEDAPFPVFEAHNDEQDPVLLNYLEHDEIRPAPQGLYLINTFRFEVVLRPPPIGRPSWNLDALYALVIDTEQFTPGTFRAVRQNGCLGVQGEINSCGYDIQFDVIDVELSFRRHG